LDQVTYPCADCQLDTGNRRFSRHGQELVLEPKVFAVLVQLLMHPGELLTREQLLDAVWGHRFVTASTLNRVIALARRAFGDDADVPRFIQTVYGAGYRYIGPIEKTTLAPEVSRARVQPSSIGAASRPAAGADRARTRVSADEEMLRDGRALNVYEVNGNIVVSVTGTCSATRISN
jgi:non-specific serine/threonine protein kinase